MRICLPDRGIVVVSEGTRVIEVEQREEPRILVENAFEIGGIRVRLCGESKADVELKAPLQPFQSSHAEFDVDIQVEWVPRIRPAYGRKSFDSGTTWRLFREGAELVFEFHAPTRSPDPYKRLLIDDRFTTAQLQMNQSSVTGPDCSPEPLGYPLDELLIMHRLTQEKAIELHGTGIVRANGDANLFVGHSGAGKSTTTRLWTEIEDVEVLSDDRIIVRRDESRPEASVETVEMLRLRGRSASPIGHSAQDNKSTKRMRMYGTPWHGEAMYASRNSAPLNRIFVLEHGHGDIITPLSPSQAVAELFARSFVPFHRHEYVDSALVFLEELANAVPVYRYAFEPDQRAVEKIRNFHD